MIRALLVIARRDIVATVLTRGFLVWLLMPLVGLAIGVLASALGSRSAGGGPEAVAVIDSDSQLRPWLEASLAEARTRAAYAGLRDRFRAVHAGAPLPAELAPLPEDLPPARLAALARPGALEALRDRADLDLGALGADLPMRGRPVPLLFVPAAADVDAQVARLLRNRSGGEARRFDAVLRLDARGARLIVAAGADPDVDGVARLVNAARERRAVAAAGLEPRLAELRAARQPLAVERAAGPGTRAPDTAAQATIGRIAASIIFMLIGLLAGVLLSNMVEEKANKVIEVLVASVPVPAIFAGKLVAMLGISAIGVALWATIVGGGAAWAVAQLPAALIPEPAVGWPLFLALCGTYLATAYLIYGAIYLGLGSLCTSIREVQSLSLPVTIVQALVLIGVLAAVDRPEGAWATVMSWFPLSSPYMMAARGATGAGLAVHLAAIAWQLAFAALVIWASARLFRVGVLHSGPLPGLLASLRSSLGQKSSLS
jgi:ABC-2 type transport system permease protein